MSDATATELRPEDGLARMRRDVEYLASLDRRTTTPGEKQSAAFIAKRLRELRIGDVQVLEFRAQSSWAWAGFLHLALGAVAATVKGWIGRGLALAALLSYDADSSARAQWLRRLLPAQRGTSVSGRVPGADAARRTLVVLAHHDAAHGGWVWSPAMTAAARKRLAAGGKALPSHFLPSLALAMIATGWFPLRLLGGALLAVAGVFFAQAMGSPTAPGANDNATAVAAALEFARRVVGEPIEGLDVILVFPGGEEIGATGTYQWLRTDAVNQLDRQGTLVLGLDSLGSGGEIAVSRRDGFVGSFDEADLEVVDRAAARAGLSLPRRVVFPNVTDAAAAMRRGFRSIGVLTLKDGWIRNLHQATDTPENVDWPMVADCVELIDAVGREWANPTSAAA